MQVCKWEHNSLEAVVAKGKANLEELQVELVASWVAD